jgi:hypothetical protein
MSPATTRKVTAQFIGPPISPSESGITRSHSPRAVTTPQRMAAAYGIGFMGKFYDLSTRKVFGLSAYSRGCGELLTTALNMPRDWAHGARRASKKIKGPDTSFPLSGPRGSVTRQGRRLSCSDFCAHSRLRFVVGSDVGQLLLSLAQTLVGAQVEEHGHSLALGVSNELFSFQHSGLHAPKLTARPRLGNPSAESCWLGLLDRLCDRDHACCGNLLQYAETISSPDASAGWPGGSGHPGTPDAGYL